MTFDVPDILAKLRIRNISESGSEVNYSCPFPGHASGDSSPSARMNKDTTQWYCHGCHRAGNGVSFVAQVMGVTPVEAIRLMNEAVIAPVHPTLPSAEFLQVIRNIIDPAPAFFGPVGLPKGVSRVDWEAVEGAISIEGEWPLEVLTYMTKQRGFSARVLNDYDVMVDVVCSRVVLPVADEHGVVLGYKGRAVGYQFGPKYLIYDPVYAASAIVYLLDTAKPAEGELIVCEGEFNALMMRQYGYLNAVGIGGSRLSNAHIELIVAKRGVRCAVIFFDDDDAGNIGAFAAAHELSNWMPTRIVGPHERDPASMSEAEVATALDQAQDAILYGLELF